LTGSGKAWNKISPNPSFFMRLSEGCIYKPLGRAEFDHCLLQRTIYDRVDVFAPKHLHRATLFPVMISRPPEYDV